MKLQSAEFQSLFTEGLKSLTGERVPGFLWLWKPVQVETQSVSVS